MRAAHATGSARSDLFGSRLKGTGRFDKLFSALDVTREAFTWYDAEDRLILCNGATLDMYAALKDVIRPGVTFRALLEAGLERGFWAVEEVAGQEWCD